jgi:hypothetical protein
MNKEIKWEVVILDNKIASLENTKGFPQDDIESHLTIIGILENLKQKHLDKIKNLYVKTVRKGDNKNGDL